tara:strand:+ start:2379 stop:2663 length:285 start_codon:yes stop_codon:yes gene_type:complete
MATRKIKISTRAVYHKYAEVVVEAPSNIQLDDVIDWLWENEDKYVKKLDDALHNAKPEYGFGIDDKMIELDSESETRYDVMEGETTDVIYGGHL